MERVQLAGCRLHDVTSRWRIVVISAKAGIRFYGCDVDPACAGVTTQGRRGVYRGEISNIFGEYLKEDFRFSSEFWGWKALESFSRLHSLSAWPAEAQLHVGAFATGSRLGTGRPRIIKRSGSCSEAPWRAHEHRERTAGCRNLRTAPLPIAWVFLARRAGRHILSFS